MHYQDFITAIAIAAPLFGSEAMIRGVVIDSMYDHPVESVMVARADNPSVSCFTDESGAFDLPVNATRIIPMRTAKKQGGTHAARWVASAGITGKSPEPLELYGPAGRRMDLFGRNGTRDASNPVRERAPGIVLYRPPCSAKTWEGTGPARRASVIRLRMSKRGYTARTVLLDAGESDPAEIRLWREFRPNSVELIASDVEGEHEGIPAGVPLSAEWATKPIIDWERNVDEYEAFIMWGQVYESAEGNPATNTRVHIKDVDVWYLSKSKGAWVHLQESEDIDGASYVADFADDKSKPADVRSEPGGGKSVRCGDGWNYHFWPPFRSPVDASDIDCLVITCAARLILHDPEGPDDRTTSRYMMSVGGDFWLTMDSQWDYWKTNGGVGVGKFRFVKTYWQNFNMLKGTREQIENNPPPMGF